MESVIVFLVVSFALGFILILKKDDIPARVRRPMAIITLIMVASAFTMLVVKLFQLGME